MNILDRVAKHFEGMSDYTRERSVAILYVDFDEAVWGGIPAARVKLNEQIQPLFGKVNGSTHANMAHAEIQIPESALADFSAIPGLAVNHFIGSCIIEDLPARKSQMQLVL